MTQVIANGQAKQTWWTRPYRWFFLLGSMLVGIALPMILTNPSHRHLLVLIGINVILVASLDLLIGYTGLISLGHGGFWGIGAYTSTLLAKQAGAPFLVGMLGAGGLAAFCGAFIGYPSLKLRGHYFVVITFISSIIINLLFTNLVDLTRGPMGIPAIPFAEIEIPGLFSYRFNPFKSTVNYYYLVLFFIFVVMFLKTWIVHSRFGRALVAIREDEDLAESVGIPTHHYKVLIFVIATGFAGIAGSLYAHYMTVISPDSFTFVNSFNLFVMNLVGGAGTLLGPVVGPVALTFVEEIARIFSPVGAEIAFGVFLIVTIVFMPKGIVGALRSVWQRRRQRQQEREQSG